MFYYGLILFLYQIGGKPAYGLKQAIKIKKM